MFVYLILSYFGDMKYYHSDNILYYKYLSCPTFIKIIEYIENNNTDKLMKKWINEINKTNIYKNYFTSEHHNELVNYKHKNIIDYRNVNTCLNLIPWMLSYIYL